MTMSNINLAMFLHLVNALVILLILKLFIRSARYGGTLLYPATREFRIAD